MATRNWDTGSGGVMKAARIKQTMMATFLCLMRNSGVSRPIFDSPKLTIGS